MTRHVLTEAIGSPAVQPYRRERIAAFAASMYWNAVPLMLLPGAANNNDERPIEEVTHMGGEPSLFNPGDRAPNNGVYIETGEDDVHMGIENPAQVELEKGQTFPETTNQNRKWTRKNQR